jgi:hypothetical protein
MPPKSKKPPSADASAKRRMLLGLIDEAYDKTGWIDRSLRGTLRGITAETASWRPAEGRHSIWEYVVHLAYWKHVLRRRILGLRGDPFPEKGQNWFARPGNGGEEAWKADRAQLAATHEALRQAIEECVSPDERVIRYAVGGAFHDVYHAAQIALLRKLAQ